MEITKKKGVNQMEGVVKIALLKKKGKSHKQRKRRACPPIPASNFRREGDLGWPGSMAIVY